MNFRSLSFLSETLRLGLANLMLHKLRSLLTALGIVCGVVAVIVMVSISEGNKEQALANIRELGARNIIVRSVKPPEQTTASSQNSMLSYGLRRVDVSRIRQTLLEDRPQGQRLVERIVPLKQVSAGVTNLQHRSSAAVFGTTPDLLLVTSPENPEAAAARIERGRFLTELDQQARDNVAVIGADVALRLFPLEDPLTKTIRVEAGLNAQVFRVVGVLRRVGLAGGAGSAQVGRDVNFDVYIPMETALRHFSDVMVRAGSGSFEATRVELSELYIQATEEELVPSVEGQVRLVLDKEHAKSNDLTMIVPLELLAQARRTMFMFNLMMALIAAISLLVGGIGIMNIMLASVTERTREIGIRRALGATRGHILAQFLTETTVLSGLGGVLGVMMGVGSAGLLSLVVRVLPQTFTGFGRPIVPVWAVALSFSVAALTGVVFGIYPAMRAAKQDPIVALRHD